MDFFFFFDSQEPTGGSMDMIMGVALMRLR